MNAVFVAFGTKNGLLPMNNGIGRLYNRGVGGNAMEEKGTHLLWSVYFITENWNA